MAWTGVRKVSDRAGVNGMDDGGPRKEADGGQGSRLEHTNPFMQVARHGVCWAGQSGRRRMYTRTDTGDSNESQATMPKKMSELAENAHHEGDAEGGPRNEPPSQEQSSSIKRQPERKKLRARPCYNGQSRTQSRIELRRCPEVLRSSAIGEIQAVDLQDAYLLLGHTYLRLQHMLSRTVSLALRLEK